MAAPAEFGEFQAAIGWSYLVGATAAGGSYHTAVRCARILDGSSRIGPWVERSLVLRAAMLGGALGLLVIPIMSIAAALPWKLSALAGLTGAALGVYGAVQGILVAQAKVTRFLVQEIALRFPLTVAGLLVVRAADPNLGSRQLLLVFLVSFIPLTSLWLFAHLSRPSPTGVHVPVQLGVVLRRSARSYTGHSALNSAMNAGDLVIASLVVTPSVLSGFALAARASALVAGLQGTVLEVHSSQLSKASRRHDRTEERRISSVIARESCWIPLLGVAGLLAGAWCFRGSIPETYRAAIAPALILIAGRWIAALPGPLSTRLNLAGGQHLVQLVLVITLPLQIVLVAWLGAGQGAAGLAIGSALTLVAHQLMLWNRWRSFDRDMARSRSIGSARDGHGPSSQRQRVARSR